MSLVTIDYRFKVLGNTAAFLASENGTALERELVVETDTGLLKVGDGVTHYNDLAYINPPAAATPCFQYTTDTGSTADSDPGAGLMKWNNATQSSATKLFFDDTDADTGTDLSAFFTELAASSPTGIVQTVAKNGAFQLYKFTSIADGTGYFKFTVTHLCSSGAFADGITVRVAFYPIPTGGGSGGYSQGTTFPGSPSTNDKFYRTDLNLLCYYDGTRWLTTQVFETSAIPGTSLMPYSTTRVANLRFALRQDYGIYITRINCQTFVAGTSNGSNYWTVAFDWVNAANTATTITSFTTASDTASNWTNHDQVVGAVLNASARNLQVSVTKTGSAGDLYDPCALCYRLIVT